jgi:hypothetical protein
MQSNQFTLANLTGGTHGGTYRLRANGRLPLRAVRALVDAPFGGYSFAGPAASAAAVAWRALRDDALDQCVSVLDLV